MAIAQRLLERRMQLLRADFTLLEIKLHQFLVDFNHLLDERTVRLGDR